MNPLQSLSMYPLAALFWTAGFAAAGLAAASIPIIIHLLNRRRFRIVQWAAMEYLLQAMRKNRRRLRFEQWLLLAMRCLLLVFLGLALAKPLGCDQSLGVLAGGKVGLHVIVIDNSLPMSYEASRPGAKTHFDQAKILAKQIIDKLADTESVAIITASNPSAAVFAKPTFDMREAKAAIDRLPQSYAAPDLAGALRLALATAKEAERNPNKVLYLLTDGTQAAMGESLPNAAELRQAAIEVGKTFAPPVVFNLGKPDQWNYAIADVKPDANIVTNKFPFDLIASANEFGQKGTAQIRWNLGESATTTAPSGPTEQALNFAENSEVRRSNTVVDSGGPRVLSAELLGDPSRPENLKADNMRYRVVDVASGLKVLIVEGERGVLAMSSSGAFLKLALAPPKDIADRMTNPLAGKEESDSYVAPDVISDLELGNKVLTDYRAIVLTNVEQISPQDAEKLELFVKQGGTLMVFMGERVNTNLYNNVLLPLKLLPGKLIARKFDTAPEPKGYTFDFNPQGVLHPALREFRTLTKSGLDTAQIYTYVQCELDQANKAEVVLNYKGSDDRPGAGDPAITLHNLGKGRVVFASTTADATWTTFPVKPAYTALMHELLQNSLSVGDRWLNLEVGQYLEVPPTLKLATAPRFRDAAGRDLPMEAVQTPDGQTVYRSKPIEKPGKYSLTTGVASFPVAVNVPIEASNVQTLKEPQIKKALGDIELNIQPADVVAAEIFTPRGGNEFGWYLMVLVLALATIECYLAMHFGHYRKQSGVARGEVAA